MGEPLCDGAAGFDKGRWPVRLSGGSGWLLPAPLARFGPSRGFPCQIPTRPWSFLRLIAALGSTPFAPADRRWPGRSGAPARATAWAPRRRRERPRGAALKTYRKFSHGGSRVLLHRVVSNVGFVVPRMQSGFALIRQSKSLASFLNARAHDFHESLKICQGHPVFTRKDYHLPFRRGCIPKALSVRVDAC